MRRLLSFVKRKEAQPQLPRLSSKEALILQLLIARGKEMYGLQLVEASDSELARGTVYVTLNRMEEKGLVSSETEPRPDHEGGLPRRLYRPTGHGQRVFHAWELMAAMVAGELA